MRHGQDLAQAEVRAVEQYAVDLGFIFGKTVIDQDLTDHGGQRQCPEFFTGIFLPVQEDPVDDQRGILFDVHLPEPLPDLFRGSRGEELILMSSQLFFGNAQAVFPAADLPMSQVLFEKDIQPFFTVLVNGIQEKQEIIGHLGHGYGDQIGLAWGIAAVLALHAQDGGCIFNDLADDQQVRAFLGHLFKIILTYELAPIGLNSNRLMTDLQIFAAI